jgi:hypothetical protein
MKYKSLMLAAALALPLSAHASGSPVPSVLFFPLVVIGAIAELFSGSPRPEPEAEAESVAQPPANSASEPERPTPPPAERKPAAGESS